MRLRLLVLLALLVALPARADSAADAAAGLRDGPVYQAPGLSLLDATALTKELTGTDPQVDVAVVPAGAATAAQVVAAVGDPQLVVLLITADQQLSAAAGADAVARGVDAPAALQAQLAAAPAPPFDRVQLTALAGAFAERIAGQVSGDGPDVTRTVPPRAATSATPATPAASGTPTSSPATTTAPESSRAPWLVGGGLLAAAAAVLSLRRRRTRRP